MKIQLRITKPNRRNRATGIRRSVLAASVASLIALSLAAPSSAATFTKQNNNTNLDQAGSWSAGGPPTGADIASFDSTVATAANINNILLGSNQTWGQLQITNPAGPLVINAAFVLTLNGVAGVGIQMGAATQDFTMSEPGSPWVAASLGTSTEDGRSP